MKKILFVILFFSVYLIGQELRGTWIARNTLNSKESIAAAMDSLAANNFNVVYINAWSRGYPLWQSDVFKSYTGISIDPIFGKRDILAEAVSEGHKRGLHVEAWFEYGFVGGWTGNQPPGGKGPIFNARPDWVAKKLDSTEMDNSNFYWMIHTHKDVQDFLIALAAEVSRNYDIDGIELDRIRYSSLLYGYDSYTDSLYRFENNGNPPPQQYNDSTWIRWRADKINEFMERSYDSIKTIGTHINVSNAPSLYSSSSYTAYNDYCQDWVWWVNNNKVDNVQVQSYVGSSSSFQAILNYLGTLISDKSKVFPAFALKPNGNPISTAEAVNFVTTSRSKGYSGNAIWYFTDLSTYFSTLKSSVFSQKTHPPYTIREWREFYKILPISDSLNAVRSGNWLKSTIFGYDGFSYYTNNQSPSSIDYYVDVPEEGYYEVYAFNVVASNRSDSAVYKVYDKSGSEHSVIVDQTISDYRRWYKLGDYLLGKGRNKIVSLSNENLPALKNLSADAVMISLNRKLSPDVILSNNDKEDSEVKKKDNSEFGLKSFPNPFNNSAKIYFTLIDLEPVQIKIFNTIGQLVVNDVYYPNNLGDQSYSLENFSVPGGVYFFELSQKQNREILKIVLIK
jgi:uncharacterized lipoprotein YddW (UPF0748 family)